jgi:hypothetical protein
MSSGAWWLRMKDDDPLWMLLSIHPGRRTDLVRHWSRFLQRGGRERIQSWRHILNQCCHPLHYWLYLESSVIAFLASVVCELYWSSFRLRDWLLGLSVAYVRGESSNPLHTGSPPRSLAHPRRTENITISEYPI